MSTDVYQVNFTEGDNYCNQSITSRDRYQQADGAKRQDPGMRDDVVEVRVGHVVDDVVVAAADVRQVRVPQRRHVAEVEENRVGLLPDLLRFSPADLAVQGERLQRERGDPELLQHGAAAQELQVPQPLAGDTHRGGQGAAPEAEGLQRPAAGENAPDRLVGDVGVAEGERAEASEARRGERDGAEAEPAERHPLQRVPDLEQVAGELQLQERRQVQDVHLDLPGAPPHGGRDPPDDVPPERAVARPCCP